MARTCAKTLPLARQRCVNTPHVCTTEEPLQRRYSKRPGLSCQRTGSRKGLWESNIRKNRRICFLCCFAVQLLLFTLYYICINKSSLFYFIFQWKLTVFQKMFPEFLFQLQNKYISMFQFVLTWWEMCIVLRAQIYTHNKHDNIMA